MLKILNGRPFHLSGGPVVGWVAVLMSVGICILYMPGMPSALVWPYEWDIVIIWAVLGFILYKVSMSKYGPENSDTYMTIELDRIFEEGED
jgi:APA family basic amino acid/polyamine antiporter